MTNLQIKISQNVQNVNVTYNINARIQTIFKYHPPPPPPPLLVCPRPLSLKMLNKRPLQISAFPTHPPRKKKITRKKYQNLEDFRGIRTLSATSHIFGFRLTYTSAFNLLSQCAFTGNKDNFNLRP